MIHDILLREANEFFFFFFCVGKMDELLAQDSPVDPGANKMNDPGSAPPMFGSTIANQAAGLNPPSAFGFGSSMDTNSAVRTA